MDVIDQQCRQFERTPGSFNVLAEEGLRDVMLSSLNALFRGAATGETFQGLGKVDIHLPFQPCRALPREARLMRSQDQRRASFSRASPQRARRII